MAGVGGSFLLARDAEGLAGTAPRPDRTVDRPPRDFEGFAPSANPGEEMTLRVSIEVFRLYVDDRAGVNISRRNQFIGYEVSQPLRYVRVELVVVVHCLFNVTVAA